MQGALLGPSFSDEEIRWFLDSHRIPHEALDRDELVAETAELLDRGAVVGWFQGRMEFGPRALGARSILGDARSAEMQSTLNLKIKFRESFRPFAPAVLEERAADWFEVDRPSPYMLFTAQVARDKTIPTTPEEDALFGIDKLKVRRSEIPAVTHVDGSARLQTVARDANPLFHDLLRAVADRTGCPVVINTSFNVRDEPIVCTPEDAFRCFMRTGMDYLVLGPFLLDKREQVARSVAAPPHQAVEAGR
jgi:carbamoyltransferase